MSAAQLMRELDGDQAFYMPLTVDQYHRMIATGILPEGEPYELLDGVVMRTDRSGTEENPTTVNHHHSWSVKKLARLGRKLEKMGCHLQTQQPVTLSPHDELEPDAAVVVGTEDDYREGHPGPDVVPCVIEVSESSLRRDRTTKLRIYADAGIGTYLIVNLRDRTIEVYSNPEIGKGRYATPLTLTPAQTVMIPACGKKGLSVRVSALLP